MKNQIDWLTLSQLPGIGTSSFWQLVHHFETPSKVLGLKQGDIAAIPGMGIRQQKGFEQRGKVRAACKEQERRLRAMGGELVCYGDVLYPSLLLEIADPPPVLFILGRKEILSETCLAVVGSRAATSYGRRTAFSLAKNLAAQGLTIVSGLALGVDTEAHRGALQSDGATIAVLGCGLDVIYPRQNRGLFQEIAKRGVLISEYPLGTLPEGFRFPARNRIIAGVSRGVLVVEAAKKSGSLITAQLALNEGREVFSVPGQVDSCKSEGTHWLLQQGARLVQSERDIFEELGYVSVSSTLRPQVVKGAEGGLDAKTADLFSCIEPYPQSRDELIRISGMQITEFSESLLVLELEGLIEILPGDEVCRIQPNDEGN